MIDAAFIERAAHRAARSFAVAVHHVRHRRCCHSLRYQPHARLCLARYLTRRERITATAWNLRRRFLPGWCPECGERRPRHKFRCHRGGYDQIVIPARITPMTETKETPSV